MHSAQKYVAEARKNMISQQVLTNHVTDTAVVAALSETPRELFVPEQYVQLSYAEGDISLGVDNDGIVRSVIDATTVARMLQLAEIQPTDTVLEIGSATGYSTALLAKLAKRVVGVECDEILAARANNTMQKIKCRNAAVHIGALAMGYGQLAPYEVVFITGGAAAVPHTLEEQCAEGGRIVWICADNRSRHMGKILFGIKHNGLVTYQAYYDTAYRMLPGLEKPVRFEF